MAEGGKCPIIGSVELAARLRRLGEFVWWIEELDPALVASAAQNQALFGPGVEELVPAYDVLAVYGVLPSDWRARLGEVLRTADEAKLHRLPICYELDLDLSDLSVRLNRKREEIIGLHVSAEFRCMAMGFQPGFGYLGVLPPELSGVPRLARPRPVVARGSVGIQGDQSAVYPTESAGGWNILGRCPTDFGNRDTGFLLSVGDRVQFFRITEQEFDHQVNAR